MERTLETITINNALEVVKLKGELKFKHPLGYTRPSGYCFKHPVKGFFAFKGDTEPFLFTTYSVILCFLQVLPLPGLPAACFQCTL
jgi:hypothetical protein